MAEIDIIHCAHSSLRLDEKRGYVTGFVALMDVILVLCTGMFEFRFNFYGRMRSCQISDLYLYMVSIHCTGLD